MLVGDSGGMVNPFNGEGIAYAMESGELAAEVAVQALARPAGPERERALAALPGRAEGPLRRLLPARRHLREADRPTRRSCGSPPSTACRTRLLMRFVLKLLANLTDPRGGDAMDRVINAMTRVAPAVVSADPRADDP